MADGPNGPAEIVKDKYDRSVGLASAASANMRASFANDAASPTS